MRGILEDEYGIKPEIEVFDLAMLYRAADMAAQGLLQGPLHVQFVLGVTPAGEVYQLARNAQSHSEFAGSTFSPDGSTLFVNIQNPGATLARTKPMRAPAKAMRSAR